MSTAKPKSDKKTEPAPLIGDLCDKNGVKLNYSILTSKEATANKTLKFTVKKFRASMTTKQTVEEDSKAVFKKRKQPFYVAPKVLKAFSTSGNDMYVTRIAAGYLYDNGLLDDMNCSVLRGVDLSKKYDNAESAEKACDLQCELYDYQVEMIEKIVAGDDSWHPAHSLSYVCMPTGSGKTIAGCGFIAERHISTFCVVPTKEIAGQWIEDIQKSLPKLRVCMVTKKLLDRDELKNYDVAVCVINTARKLEHTQVQYFGQMLIDEAHEAYTKVNCRVLWLAQCFKYAVGFSATPAERKDGLDKHVYKFLGPPVLCNLEMPKYNFRVNIIEFYGDNEFCQPVVNNGILCATSTIEKLAKEPARVELICSLTRRLVVDEKKSIFVFAEHRELLTIYRDKLLSDFKDLSAELEIPELGILKGGVKGAEAKEAREAKIVLTTYGYSRRGVSIKEKTVLVMATPRRTPLAQIFGRIIRRGGPGVDVIREVHFIADMKSPIKGQVESIKEYAQKMHYNVTKTKVKPGTKKKVEPEDEDE